MRKLSFFLLGASLSFSFAFCNIHVDTNVASADAALVYVGGMSAGFTLRSGSPQIVGLCEIMTENGVSSPALKAGLKTGDKIVSVNGIKIDSITRLNEIVNKSNGKKLSVVYKRGENTNEIFVYPVKDKVSGNYKIGVLARDSVSGIGTVTYIDQSNGRFASLGHTVEGENRQKLQISDGTVYECSIVGVNKGVRGRAGELRGMFIGDKRIGTAEKLCDCGIFGSISKEFDYTGLSCAVADSSSAVPGDAYIYSTVNGICPKKYEIEIVKVDRNAKDNKDFVIKITDDALIAETGGIVQGMSGSPILQNGKLIGAVTHVFLNDPTRGYGIDIQTMLKE
ncbi:MAG: SpoIVB peptidase [Clostridiales bacterium]|nr:SpoIVB peptidase [Clostridiales bacterium]